MKEGEERVGIAELKARLSHYLRVVKAGGAVTVLDRDRPVARLVPVARGERLVIERPAPGTPRPGDFRPLPRVPLSVDVDELLREERADRF